MAAEEGTPRAVLFTARRRKGSCSPSGLFGKHAHGPTGLVGADHQKECHHRSALVDSLFIPSSFSLHPLIYRCYYPDSENPIANHLRIALDKPNT